MSKYIYKFKFHYNLILFLIFILYVKDEEILNLNSSGIFTKYLNNSKEIEYQWNYDSSLIIFNILSFDCEIDIKIDFINTYPYAYVLSDYNYKVYYLRNRISKGNMLRFKIFPINQSLKEKNQNRYYPLIINYFVSYKLVHSLNIKENEPIFLSFWHDFEEGILLKYKFENSLIEQPIIFSFFNKEKLIYRIEISDDKNNTIINKNMIYKENVLIKPESNKTYNIFIILEDYSYVVPVLGIIIRKYSTPFYLQKNQLNLGFAPYGIYYFYYYMDVFKGEEGEIILFNKLQNGILISKIIKKNNNIIPEESKFPEYKENENYLEFNIYNQKLKLKSSDTEQCEEGCFLLITYYSNTLKSLDINGTEFSILSRIWDEEELKPQLINIPLDEYIFGTFNETNVNTHYYFTFIPYKTDDIYIEIHGMNILGYSQGGMVKIDTTNKTAKFKKLFDKCQNKMIIKLNKTDIGLDSFERKNVSFLFERENNDIQSSYYFRILQKNPKNDYIIYPLDTNKENYCETINNTCHFLLKNEYNDLSNRILVYNFEKINISYKVFYINDDDYYSNNFNNLNEINETKNFNGLLSFDLKKNEHFILIEVESTDGGNLTIISNIDKQSNSPSIDKYSYQLYHLSENQFQQFNLIQNPYMKYRILINSTEGEGYICFNKPCDSIHNYIHITQQKIYSFSIYNKESFFIFAENNLTYNIKIIDEISNEVIKELNYQHNFENINSNKESIPLIYFIKDVKYNGINIYFKFNDSNNEYNNLTIKGYSLDYSEILSIKERNDIKMMNFTNEIIGKYDNITNSGTIELNNELIQSRYKNSNKYIEDKYFMIIFENITSINLRNDIYVFSKEENYILLPINRYIRSSFNLIENKSIAQKYFFDKENIPNNKLILEFSSNYEKIDLEFNNLTNNGSPKIAGGFKQYVISINSNNSNDFYFKIVIKPNSQLNSENALKEVNIIIKYYTEEKKINAEYFYNKNLKLKANNTENCSDYSLIIKNKNNKNDINYYYYLRLIKKKNVLVNEELNTIALISSNLSYIDKFNSNETEFYLNNLEYNETYIAIFFIKVENINEEEEYYSMLHEFNTAYPDKDDSGNEENNNIITSIILIIIIVVLIFVFLLMFIIWRKIRINKFANLENKVNDTNFSSGLNENLNDNQELSDNIRGNGNYINAVI